MRRKGMLAISLLCGLICALCVSAYLQAEQARFQAQRDEALSRYGGDQVQVCVATRDIAPGEAYSSANVELRSWIAELSPRQAVGAVSDIEGKQAAGPVSSGEVITVVRCADNNTAAIQVPAGKQAVSIAVESSQAVGGSLEAGVQVSVYSASSSGSVAYLCDAQVLAAGTYSAGRMWVTLAVDPAQVQEVIAAARDSSSVYLTLPAEGEVR